MRKNKLFLLLVFFLLITIPLTVWAVKTQRLEIRKRAEFTTAGPAVRGQINDLWADVEIGKRDFTEISAREIVPYKLFNPGGVIVDRSVSPGRAYIWDSSNSRILGIDLNKCYQQNPPCTADIVIGQPSGSDYGACNMDASGQYYPNRGPASASTLCGNSEFTHTTLEDKSFVSMFVDQTGNLYVPDSVNHRVLKYITPFTTDSAADEVWGQRDFSGNGCNASWEAVSPSPSFSCSGGCYSSPANCQKNCSQPCTKLGGTNAAQQGCWSGAYRCCQTSTPVTSTPPPGQSTTPTASSLCFHSEGSSGAGVALDSSGNLWVADGGNNRVLRFSKNLSSGAIAKNADLVLGQPNFTTGGNRSYGNGMNQMHAPSAITFDSQGKLYVADTGNNRVLVFKPPFSNGISADATFGLDFEGVTHVQSDPNGKGIWTFDSVGYSGRVRLWNYNGTLRTLLPLLGNRGGGSIGIDILGNILPSAYVYGQDVYRFSPQADGTFRMDKELFSPPGGYNLISNRRLEHSAWTGVGIVGHQLVVTDGRLLFWNNYLNLTNGQPPDGYLGTQSFTEIPKPGYGQIKTDLANRVWVTKSTKIEVYQAPLSINAQPIKSLADSIPALSGGELKLIDIAGIAPTPDGNFLWVSEPGNHRVFRIRNPLTNPLADIILGQNKIANNTSPDNQFHRSIGNDPAHPNQCNRGEIPPPNERPGRVASLDMLCFPGAISLDRKGNLFVSDHMIEGAGNWRLLMFSKNLFSNDNTQIIFAPKATKSFGYTTFEPAFDSTNRMVVGNNPYFGNRFVNFYHDPTRVNPDNPSDPNYAFPDGQLNDFYGWPVAATFDPYDNLYVMDANRGKVMLYKQPFSNSNSPPIPSSAPTLPPLPTLTPTPTPIPTSTPTPTPTLTPTPTPITHPISWQTNAVSLQADDFYIMADGQKYFGNVDDVQLQSNPGDNATTLEAKWQEHDSEMSIHIFFKKDSEKWWADAIVTANGQTPSGWFYYFGLFFKSPLETTFTGDVDLKSTALGGSNGEIHFGNLRLQAFLNLTTPTFIPTPTPITPSLSCSGGCYGSPASCQTNCGQPCTKLDQANATQQGCWLNAYRCCQTSSLVTPTPTLTPPAGQSPTPKTPSLSCSGGCYSSPVNCQNNCGQPCTRLDQANATQQGCWLGAYRCCQTSSSTSFTSSSFLSGDANRDNVVNIQDLGVLVRDYLKTESPADFNLDGVVNIQDFQLMVENYLKEGE